MPPNGAAENRGLATSSGESTIAVGAQTIHFLPNLQKSHRVPANSGPLSTVKSCYSSLTPTPLVVLDNGAGYCYCCCCLPTLLSFFLAHHSCFTGKTTALAMA
jgi:hypothetical protein